MPTIRPFKGIHYNTKMIPDLSQVVTPPYDNISEADKPKYLQRSPYNFTHLILPREGDENYRHTTELLGKWKQTHVLQEDPTPHYYLYRQSFTVDGKKLHRHSLMALVPLTDFSKGEVRPHENTHGKHKEDRLRILRATGHNLSHVFAMVRDPEAYLASLYEAWCFDEPFLTATTDDGVEQRVWRVPASKAPDLAAFFATKPLYILDGHHRYSSALMYAQEKGVVGTDDPAAFMLFSISNSADPALRVFPTHRRVKGYEASKFPWEEFEKKFITTPMDEGALKTFVTTPSQGPYFALWTGDRCVRCEPKGQSEGVKKYGKALSHLAVPWSDDTLLGDLLGIAAQERVHALDYERDWNVFWNERNKSGLMIFHAPPPVDSVAAVADEGGFMPQKSTYFFPKLAAGLVLRSHHG